MLSGEIALKNNHYYYYYYMYISDYYYYNILIQFFSPSTIITCRSLPATHLSILEQNLTISTPTKIVILIKNLNITLIINIQITSTL